MSSFFVNFAYAFAAILAAFAFLDVTVTWIRFLKLVFKRLNPSEGFWQWAVDGAPNLFRGVIARDRLKEMKPLTADWQKMLFYPMPFVIGFLVALLSFPQRQLYRFNKGQHFLQLVALISAFVGGIFWAIDRANLGQEVFGGVIFLILGSIFIYVIIMPFLFLFRWIYRLIKGKPKEPVVPEYKMPVVFYYTLEGVTVVFTEEAYLRALKWHLAGVKAGYRSSTEKIVVNPCFIYYSLMVLTGQKNRSVNSSVWDEFNLDIMSHLHPEVRIVHVPFLSKDRRQQAIDRELFGSPDKTSHNEALKAIYPGGADWHCRKIWELRCREKSTTVTVAG